jgi:hypothetical protein
MAELDALPLESTPVRHDGLAICRVCCSADAAAAHDWCLAVRGLLCDACCRRILIGEEPRMAWATCADDAEGAPLVDECLGCDRGHRWFAEQFNQHSASDGIPC